MFNLYEFLKTSLIIILNILNNKSHYTLVSDENQFILIMQSLLGIKTNSINTTLIY